MKTAFKLIVLGLFLALGLNSYGQCCKAFAGPAKSYCKDSVQIGGSPADSVSGCPFGCTSVSFLWTPASGLSNPHVANPWAHPSSTTVYTLEVIVISTITHDTCCKSTSTTTVTVLPRCKANAGTAKTICCAGTQTVTLGGSPSAVDSCSGCDSTIYSWKPTTGLNNSHIANPSASPLVTTTYTLTIYAVSKTTHDTCCNATSTVKVTVSSICCRTAGIQPAGTNPDFKVYPNPASQAFTIQIDHDLINGSIEVYDVNGKLIWQKRNLTGSGKQAVDLAEYPKGMYFVRVKDQGEEIFAKKVLLQ